MSSPDSSGSEDFLFYDLSPNQKPLRTKDLRHIVVSENMTPKLSEQARTRIREEMKRQRLVQRDIAGMLSWSQSRVAKVLTGRVALLLDDLAALCFALSVSIVDVLRDRGMEFCSEMTPTELRIHESMRALSQNKRTAVMTLLDIMPAEPKRAIPKVAPRQRVNSG